MAEILFDKQRGPACSYCPLNGKGDSFVHCDGKNYHAIIDIDKSPMAEIFKDVNICLVEIGGNSVLTDRDLYLQKMQQSYPDKKDLLKGPRS